MIIGSDPHAQYLALRADIDSAIQAVLEQGRYILGEESSQFEQEFAEYLGAQYYVGVGNGTDAVELALSACGIGSGDEVITVSHTAVATVAAIVQTGATPVLVDVEPDTYTMAMGKLESAISANTKAIIPVHLYGHPANIPALQRIVEGTSIRIIEDCAQAHGAKIGDAKVGSLGDAACFSFYPTKNLGAIGDGGAVTSNDPEIAKQVRLLREYGWEDRFISSQHGRNSRLDEIQAAILRVKLQHLDTFNTARQSLANEYSAALADLDLELPHCENGIDHVYHQYVIKTKARDELLAFLQNSKIMAGVHYPQPVHKQRAYESIAQCSGNLESTNQLCEEILSLPIYPELGRKVQTVIDQVKAYFD